MPIILSTWKLIIYVNVLLVILDALPAKFQRPGTPHPDCHVNGSLDEAISYLNIHFLGSAKVFFCVYVDVKRFHTPLGQTRFLKIQWAWKKPGFRQSSFTQRGLRDANNTVCETWGSGCALHWENAPRVVGYAPPYFYLFSVATIQTHIHTYLHMYVYVYTGCFKRPSTSNTVLLQ